MSKIRKLLPLAAFFVIVGASLGACGSDAPPAPASGGSAEDAGLQQAAASQPQPTSSPTAGPGPAASQMVTPPATDSRATAGSTAPVATAEPTATAAPEATATPAEPDRSAPTPETAVTPRASPAPLTQQQALAVAAGKETVRELAAKAWDTLVALTNDLSPRESATEEELTAAEFLLAEFQGMGYGAELQPFTVELLSTETPILSITTTTAESMDVQAIPMGLSGTGRVSGPVADAGSAFAEDIPEEGLAGKVALIRRGSIMFEEKVSRVAESGAIAAVVYNNESGLFRGTLQNQGSIPALAISEESGLEIAAMLGAGDVQATVSVVTEVRDSRNVIAEKPGTAGDGRVVVLGAHFDTVADTQGANDNGSGTATLLTVAREVSAKSYPFTLRFIAFGAEEVGLFGSRFHVDSLSTDEREDIVAMLNFDALGTGDVTGVFGSFDLTGRVVDYGRANGIEVERRFDLGSGSSDHAPFAAAGIPAIFFLADDFSRINSPRDTIEFVQPELMGTSAALAIGLLDSLAGTED